MDRCTTTFAACAFGIAPNNTPGTKVQQQCLSQFNSSAFGKTVNFFSATSFALGPDKFWSSIETFVGTPLKYKLVTAAQAAGAKAPGWEAGTFRVWAADLANATEFIAEKAGVPVVVAATGVQVLTHAGCASLGLQTDGLLTPVGFSQIP